MGESDYSFSLTTFSPSGKLVQIEYALNAVAAGSTSLGIKGNVLLISSDPMLFVFRDFSSTATNGVVVATEKKVNSPLVDETTLHKIAEIDKHIGIYFEPCIEFALIWLTTRLQAWFILGWAQMHVFWSGKPGKSLKDTC